MKCFKCGKEMDREDDSLTIKGCSISVRLPDDKKTVDNIAYNNNQLGKYSDGMGECNVAICYECYIDGLFNAILTDCFTYNHERERLAKHCH